MSSAGAYRRNPVSRSETPAGNTRLLAAEAIARKLLEEHRDLHHEIATRLSVTGVVSGDELREMISDAAARPS